MEEKNASHTLWFLVQYRAIRLLLTLLSAVPGDWLKPPAAILGALWYVLDRRHRTVAFENMRRAFAGEKGSAEIRRLVRANFVQFARLVLELPALFRLSKGNLTQFAALSGHRHLKAAMGRGKGAFLLTAHMGNWELMALVTSLLLDAPIHVVARPLDYRPLDRVLTELRCRTGNRLIDKKNGAPRIIRALRNNEAVGILLDQNASWYDGVYVPFFGQTACTSKGVAMFALRYEVPVVPMFSCRRPDGRYQIMIEPPVELIRTGNLQRDIVENTAVFNRVMEKYIRMAPDNWLWVHNRWREKKIPEKFRDKVLQVTWQAPSPPTRHLNGN